MNREDVEVTHKNNKIKTKYEEADSDDSRENKDTPLEIRDAEGRCNKEKTESQKWD